VSAEDYIKLSVRYRVDFAMTSTSAFAELLFIRSLAYCGLNGTAGCIPATELPALAAGLKRPADLVAELIAGDYWQTMPNGWGIRQWSKWQHEYDAIQAKRVRDAQRMRDKRAADALARETGDVA
jgi:hypothetical protein